MLAAVFFAAALAAASAVSGQSAGASAEDLAGAGYTGVQPLDPAGNRFSAPVKYFRVKEILDDVDAKKDCQDCRDLVAVYAGESKEIPGWSINQKNPMRKMGGRWQYRNYVGGAKTVVIVTGPHEDKVRRLGESLRAKAEL